MRFCMIMLAERWPLSLNHTSKNLEELIGNYPVDCNKKIKKFVFPFTLIFFYIYIEETEAMTFAI